MFILMLYSGNVITKGVQFFVSLQKNSCFLSMINEAYKHKVIGANRIIKRVRNVTVKSPIANKRIKKL